MFKLKLWIITPILLPHQPHSRRCDSCWTLLQCCFFLSSFGRIQCWAFDKVFIRSVISCELPHPAFLNLTLIICRHLHIQQNLNTNCIYSESRQRWSGHGRNAIVSWNFFVAKKIILNVENSRNLDSFLNLSCRLSFVIFHYWYYHHWSIYQINFGS